MGMYMPVGNMMRPPALNFTMKRGEATIPSSVSAFGRTESFQSRLHVNDNQIGSLVALDSNDSPE